MSYILLIAATLLCSGKALVAKLIGSGSKSVHDVLLLNSALFFVGAITAGITGMGGFDALTGISAFSLGLAVVFSVFLLFTLIMQSYAMSNGPASIGSLIYSLGFLIPIFYSARFLNESVSIYQWGGIVLMIISLVLIIPPEKGRKFSVTWIIFALLAMLGSGANAVVQKIHQNSAFKNELCVFLLYALFLASVLALIVSIITKTLIKEAKFTVFTNKKTIFLIIVSGLVVGLMNVVNTNLAGKLPAVIQFPVYNICSMIITALWGRLFFKEKLSGRKLFGFVLGLISVTIIGLL